uniref:(northern house mosquito) hypothetical protein n=1 Tax=Culex pipiens TaxID=7175 RepID=A0A8D8MVG5_CULPI
MRGDLRHRHRSRLGLERTLHGDGLDGGSGSGRRSRSDCSFLLDTGREHVCCEIRRRMAGRYGHGRFRHEGRFARDELGGGCFLRGLLWFGCDGRGGRYDRWR